jgi:hypothetical protein
MSTILFLLLGILLVRLALMRGPGENLQAIKICEKHQWVLNNEQELQCKDCGKMPQ